MSKGTNCRDAIKQWEQKTGMIAAESKEIKLMCQIPPIEKMDDSLNSLIDCQKLALSSNQIERIISLPKLKNLKVLSLGRNNIKKLQGLDEIGKNLEELWISYNFIEKLDGLHNCQRLIMLFISNNKIKSWDEVAKLAALTEIKSVIMTGNPIYQDRQTLEVMPMLVRRVPQLEQIDGKMVSAHIRKLAEEMPEEEE